MPPNTKHPSNSIPTYLTALDAAIDAKRQESNGSAFPTLTTESNIGPVDNVFVTAKKDEDNGVIIPDLEADTGSTLKSTLESNPIERAVEPQLPEHHEVRKILRKYSSTVQDPEQFTLDEKRIQHALSDAGKYVYGIQGISVWVFDEDHDRLVLPPGGFWYHPTNNETSDAMDEVIDNLRAHHQTSITPVAPGTDIAGLLWLESSNHEHHHHSFWHPSHAAPPESSSFLHHHRQHDAHHHSPHKHGGDSTPGSHHTREASHTSTSTVLVWRDLNSLVQDPDVAKGPTLLLLEQAGFGQAAGITFHAGVCSGLVIFFVQSGLDPKLLNSTVHTAYLYQSAQFIGTAAALTEARRATIGQMDQAKEANGTTTIESSDDERNQKETLVDELDQRGAKTDKSEEEHTPTCFSITRRRLYVWLSKIGGGGLQVPPALSTQQSLWTTFGAFCGLMVLAALNKIYMTLSDDYYFLLIEPFGALMTLQYGLTAAPASQPRNAIMGQAVAGAVSLSFTYIPEYIFPYWFRRVIGPAVAIGVMVKLGFTHPPAGAHAIVYSSGKYNFQFYALVVLSTVVSTIPATLVNNMSRKRQYPTFWGFPSFLTNLVSGNSKGTGNNT